MCLDVVIESNHCHLVSVFSSNAEPDLLVVLMSHNIYLYIFVMAGVTYLIRLLPLTFIRKEIKNTYIRSFLYYVPYVTLSVMTFPAILSATDSLVSALVGFAAAILIAWKGVSLIKVSAFACVAVFLVELFL